MNKLKKENSNFYRVAFFMICVDVLAVIGLIKLALWAIEWLK